MHLRLPFYSPTFSSTPSGGTVTLWARLPSCFCLSPGLIFVSLSSFLLTLSFPYFSVSGVLCVGSGGASKRTHWEGHIRWRAFWLCCRLGFYPPRRRCKQFHLYTAKLQTCVLPAVLMTNDTAGTSLSEVGRWNVEFVPKVKPHVLTCFTRWHGGARGWVGWTDNRLLW